MASTPRRSDTKTDDFQISELLADHGEHGKNISDLTVRVSKIEGRLETPQKVAAFLSECAEDSRVMEGVFAKMFCRFMAENPEVQEAVKKKMEEIDHSYMIKALRRFGGALYAFVLLIGGMLLKALVDWFLSIIPHVK